ncbi:hypothetical protein F2Q68_00037240 [Brassica cretica]|uniref:Transmembrane protein n=1 Tax=Brassica cretica TaxID=69181 RepID=A0A8S9H3P0_BRACR|nr:hypothetical protein F2Q68_00037240 [Brassica cretica]
MFPYGFVRSMETGVAVTGQEIGPGIHTPVNPDGYVTIDVESFSHVIHKDISSSSPRVTASTVRPIDHVGTDTIAATIVSASPLHQITVTTTAATGGNVISEQNRERRFGFARKSSFKRSRTSWMLDPKKILIFFATLSSMGSILLIIFTLSISKSNPGDMV